MKLLKWVLMATLGLMLAMAPLQAQAAIIIIDGQATCMAAPVTGQWDAATSTCTLSGLLVLDQPDALAVAFGVTLGRLDNPGQIQNDGLLEIVGDLSNSGSLINSPGVIIHNIVRVTNEPGGTLDNAGILQNPGVVDNRAGARLVNRLGASFDNGGQLLTLCAGFFVNQGWLTGNPPELGGAASICPRLSSDPRSAEVSWMPCRDGVTPPLHGKWIQAHRFY